MYTWQHFFGYSFSIFFSLCPAGVHGNKNTDNMHGNKNTDNKASGMHLELEEKMK